MVVLLNAFNSVMGQNEYRGGQNNKYFRDCNTPPLAIGAIVDNVVNVPVLAKLKGISCTLLSMCRMATMASGSVCCGALHSVLWRLQYLPFPLLATLLFALSTLPNILHFN